MGLLDPILTKDEYSALAHRTVEDDDVALDSEVEACTRTLEKELGVAPGSWNSDHGTRLFSGNGDTDLVLRDELGLHFLVELDAAGVTIDVDGDGVPEYTVAPATEQWVALIPRNAAALGESHYALRLLRRIPGISVPCWPEGDFNLGFTGTWGHAATPQMPKQIVAFMVRDLRDHHAGQSFAVAQQLAESGIPVRDDTWRLMRIAKLKYSHRRPGVG